MPFPAEWFRSDEGSDGIPAAEIDALLALRTAAREARDFAEADRIRDRLTEMGVTIEDSTEGPRWRRVDN